MTASARPATSKLALLFTALTLLLCLGNETLPLIDRDEPRFAEASREMLQSGNWVVPQFNNTPRYDKPPLIYWMHIACYKALGVNAFAARLPAALCTAAAGVCIALWGSRLATPAAGLQASLIFALCVQNFIHGRAAVADPPMVLFSILAAWAGWEWLKQPGNRLIALTFWVSLALGFLAKGPIAWVPLGMTGWAFWKNRRSQPSPSPFSWLLGSCLMLGIVALWGIPALLQTRGEFAAVGLGEHVVNRSIVSMEGHGAKNLLGYLATLPLYFLTVFPSFAPWSFWLPAAIRSHWKQPSADAAFLLSGAILTFGIFTLSRTKLPHYPLPAFPYLALLLALWWQNARPMRLWRKTAAITTAVFACVPLLIFPLVRELSASEAILSVLSQKLTPDTAVALVDYREPSLIWGLRARINGYPESIDESKVAEWLAQPGQRLCILSAEAATKTGTFERIAEARAWNFAKGKRLSLRAIAGPSTASPAPSNPSPE